MRSYKLLTHSLHLLASRFHCPQITIGTVNSNNLMAFRDDWPKMHDGTDFDGKQLLTLVRSGNSPFDKVWDVNLLIREVEENLCTKVIDIPVVDKGSNNYVSLSFQSSLYVETEVGWRPGFPPQAIGSTRHRGAIGSWRCQHAQL